MVRSDFLRRFQLRLPLSIGKSALRKLRPEISDTARALIRLICFASVAIALGFTAEESSRARIQKEFEEAHLPNQEAWSSSLEKLGWKLAPSPSQALRNLPTQADSPGAVWWNGNRQILIVFNPKPDQAPWAFNPEAGLSRAAGRPNPSEWESLGRGWDALGATLTRIRALPAPKLKKAAVLDPRALVY